MNPLDRRPRIPPTGLIVPLCILALSACGDKSRRPPDPSTIEPELSHEALECTRLEATRSATSDSLGLPIDLLYLDGHVVVTDYPDGGSAVHLYTADGLRHVTSFGRLGDGPGEFRGPPSVHGAGEEGAFWAYDASLARLTLFRLDDLRRGEFKGVRHVPFIVERVMYGLAFLDRDRAVGLGLFADGRFALLDGSTRAVRYAGELPPSKDGTPPNVVQNAYYGQLAAHPSGSRFALATVYGGKIEVYDGEGSLLQTANTPFPFEPDYLTEHERWGPIMVRGFLNRGGYVSLATTDDFIFALFSGRAQIHHRGNYTHAEYLHVFDWDGELRRVFRFDRLVRHIAVSPEGDALFATTDVPEPTLIRFPLPEIDPTGSTVDREEEHMLPVE